MFQTTEAYWRAQSPPDILLRSVINSRFLLTKEIAAVFVGRSKLPPHRYVLWIESVSIKEGQKKYILDYYEEVNKVPESYEGFIIYDHNPIENTYSITREFKYIYLVTQASSANEIPVNQIWPCFKNLESYQLQGFGLEEAKIQTLKNNLLKHTCDSSSSGISGGASTSSSFLSSGSGSHNVPPFCKAIAETLEMGNLDTWEYGWVEPEILPKDTHWRGKQPPKPVLRPVSSVVSPSLSPSSYSNSSSSLSNLASSTCLSSAASPSNNGP